MVICVHVSQAVPDAPSLVKQVGYYGMFGVQLFFVLSAFSLSLAYGQSFRYLSWDFLRFMIRRWFRIAPLYLLGIALYYFLRESSGDTQPAATSILYHSFLLHGLIPSAFEQVVPGGWSIGCEWAFYLAFPMAHTFAMNQSPKATLGLSILSSVCYPLALYAIGKNMPIRGWSFLTLNFGCQAPCFLLGLAAHASWNRGIRYASTALFSVLCFGLLANGLVKIAGPAASLASPFLCGITFASGTLLALQYQIQSVVLKWIGNISYSIYILHFIFTSYLLNSSWFTHSGISWFWRLAAAFILTVLGSTLLASITHHLIESPSIKAGKWLCLHLRPDTSHSIPKH